MQVESGGDRPGPRIPVERIDEPAKASPPRPPETLIAAKPGRVPERRKRPRTTSLRNVVCLVGGTRHKALVAEISETGGYLYSHWMPRPGDNLSILFRPSDDTIGPAIIIASRVVRVVEKPATPGGVSGFSVKWLVLRTEGRLARLQAATSPMVTNLCHMPVQLDEVARQLLLLLDGTRTRETLVRRLAARCTRAGVAAKIRRALPESLDWMARMALLEG